MYEMLDAAGRVLYVGKARNLRRRVESYFGGREADPRIRALIARVADIRVTLTASEGEALLLESRLIKLHRPRYNVLLRDDKSYPYLLFEESEGFVRLAFHRGPFHGQGRLYGPYPSAAAVRETIGLLQRLFRLRVCEDTVFRHRSRPCLEHQIGRCSAPCVGLIGAEAYRADAERARRFLEGHGEELLGEVTAEMERAAERLDFERAAMLRDAIVRLREVQAQHRAAGGADYDVLACRRAGRLHCVQILFFRNGAHLGGRSYLPRVPGPMPEDEVLEAFIAQYYLERMPPPELIVERPLPQADWLAEALSARAGRRVRLLSLSRGERLRWVELAARNAEAALASARAQGGERRRRLAALAELLGMAEPPRRIECFDVSHTGGEEAMASCVVFEEGAPLRREYRRFRIAGIAPGDDYAALAQAIARRWRRIRRGEHPAPELLVIDGGERQLACAASVLAELAGRMPALVAIAKGSERRPGLESLHLVDGRVLCPDPHHEGFLLLRAIRDEAHRHALEGHRRRRDPHRGESWLEGIPGIGPARRRVLLRHFGGLAGIRSAGVGDLMRVPGIDRRLAERIHAALGSGGGR